MLTLLIGIIAMATPQVPEAEEVAVLQRQDIADALHQQMQHLAVISDDGAAVFLHVGRIRRFLLGSRKPAPGEDVFYAYVDRIPTTYTTSQAAHVQPSAGSRGVEKDGIMRVAAAPNKDLVAIGRRTGAGLWLTTINWNTRTRHPNVDTVVPGDKGYYSPRLMCATISGGQPVFYTMTPRKQGDALVHRRRHRGAGTLLGRSSFEGEVFDPVNKVMLRVRKEGVRLEKIGGKARVVEQPPIGSRTTAIEYFFHKGHLFAICDRMYKLVGNEWKPFGNGFVVLAKSANDKYWLVAAEDESVWKVTF